MCNSYNIISIHRCLSYSYNLVTYEGTYEPLPLKPRLNALQTLFVLIGTSPVTAITNSIQVTPNRVATFTNVAPQPRKKTWLKSATFTGQLCIQTVMYTFHCLCGFYCDLEPDKIVFVRATYLPPRQFPVYSHNKTHSKYIQSHQKWTPKDIMIKIYLLIVAVLCLFGTQYMYV